MTDPSGSEPTSLRDLILALAAAAGPGKSINPNDVAKAAAARKAKPTDPPDTWRRYTKQVRAEAIGLAREGKLIVLRKGKPADATKPVKGIIRLALPEDRPG